jgi:hypothetical protein
MKQKLAKGKFGYLRKLLVATNYNFSNSDCTLLDSAPHCTVIEIIKIITLLYSFWMNIHTYVYKFPKKGTVL